MKSTSVINEIYQTAFGQRKFINENALKEITKSFQIEVWLLIILSMIILPSILSLKHYIKFKKEYLFTFNSLVFHLISSFLLNNAG